jgi:MFS family permease
MVSDRLARRDRRWPLWIVAATFAVGTPLQLAVFLAPSFMLALVACAANALVGSVYTGPAFSLIQGLSGARLRATGAAIFLVIGNLAGLGFGPSLVGLLSDAFAAAHGKDSLRIALTFMPVFYVIGVAWFLLATRTLERDAASSEMATEAA